MKSTHNLLRPVPAIKIVQTYNSEYIAVQVNQNGRTTRWNNVNHPLGQLLCYMLDNECSYGALTSATRTYFVRISDDAEVFVSDAWFVGQENYLRTWANVNYLGCQDVGGKTEKCEIMMKDWKYTKKKGDTPDRDTNRDQPKNQNEDKRPDTQNEKNLSSELADTYCQSNLSALLPYI